ncbi:YheC/YheD family protein [Priestia megaterium]|nr:YheC/YheD family protein [Priestia megaterium]
MKNSLIELILAENESNCIYVPKKFYHEKLETVCFGTLSVPCQIKVMTASQHQVKISQDLIEQLKIPFCQPLHISATATSLHLGPLIGILSAGFTGSLLRPIGRRSLLFAKLLSTASITGGFPFLFGIHHVNWEHGTINGYFYTNNGWEQQEVPLPNVIYNRLPNRKTESLALFKTMKEQMADYYGIPFFNPDFFNKWTIHELLQTRKETNIFLPETVEAPTLEEIQSMLKRYSLVYLKPKSGSLGRGIYAVTYNDDSKTYTVRYKDSSEMVEKQNQDFKTLAQATFSPHLTENYIVQQGILLLRKDNRVVDFRVHTNKNKENKWEMTALAAKVAGKDSVTTHMTNGGDIEPFQQIFTNPSTSKKMKTAIEHAAITISHVLEEQIAGFIGEIGFDFGVDNEGKIWLFEANSKPGRSIFTHPALRREDHYTRRLSLEYAIYLAHQAIESLEATYI